MNIMSTSTIAGTGVMPGNTGEPTEPMICEACGFKGKTLTGFHIHQGKCAVKRTRDLAAGATPVKAPITLGSSKVKDPVIKQIEVYEQLVAVVRKSNIKHIAIEHDGKDWHVDARWTE
jgi:hypothetical protein